MVHEDGTDDMYEFTIDGAVLRVTEAHRFYVVTDGKYDWVAAKNLKV